MRNCGGIIYKSIKDDALPLNPLLPHNVIPNLAKGAEE